MSLPIMQSDSKEMSLMQTRWASEINPLLNNPLSSGILLKSILLSSGATIINHKLGRKLQGWTLTRQRAAASVYDTQDSNPNPSLTLSLVSSASVLVDLYVF